MPVTFTTNLPSPSNVDIDTTVAGEITITWSVPDDNSNGELEIYRSTSPTNLGSKVADGVAISTTSYTDTTVTSNTAYYYTIRRVTPG